MSEKVIEFIPNNYVSKGQISINGTVYHNIPYEITDEFTRIVEENQQLKDVIEEVREFVEYNSPNLSNSEIYDLLQILDKGVKDE